MLDFNIINELLINYKCLIVCKKVIVIIFVKNASDSDFNIINESLINHKYLIVCKKVIDIIFVKK